MDIFKKKQKSQSVGVQVNLDNEAQQERSWRAIMAEWTRSKEPVEANTQTVSTPPQEEYSLAPDLTEEQKRDYICNGYSWQDMMDAYKDAPYDARVLVDHLYKKSLDPSLRAAFFVGLPGTGKTATALAIPHCAHWFFDFIPSSQLLSQYRNQAKEKLAAHLVRAISQKRKTVVVIDEINRLLEHFDSDKHDSDATATALWTFLDSQKRNNNFFLIGTMNEDDKLPDPFKSRGVGTTVRFKPLTPEKLRTIFKNKIVSPVMELDSECTDAFIDRFVQLLQHRAIDISPRDYESMRLKIARLTYENDPDSAVRKIKQHHIFQALQYIIENYLCNKYGQKKLTDAEWRDFNVIQNRIIDVRLQCAQKVQMGLNVGACTGVQIGRAPGLDMNEVVQILEEEFTDEQKALYTRVMKRDYLIQRGLLDTIKQAVNTKSYGTLVGAVSSAVLPVLTFTEIMRTTINGKFPLPLPAGLRQPLLTEKK